MSKSSTIFKKNNEKHKTCIDKCAHIYRHGQLHPNFLQTFTEAFKEINCAAFALICVNITLVSVKLTRRAIFLLYSWNPNMLVLPHAAGGWHSGRDHSCSVGSFLSLELASCLFLKTWLFDICYIHTAENHQRMKGFFYRLCLVYFSEKAYIFLEVRKIISVFNKFCVFQNHCVFLFLH